MNTSRICRAALVLIASIAAALGDTVEMKTGERTEGHFRQATDAGVVIEIGGQTVTFPLDKVKAIYFGSAVEMTKPPAPNASGEAMDSLKALQSIASMGVSYRDYTPKVLDAKVKVDKYMAETASQPSPSRSAIGLAMRFYELGAQAWNIKVSGNAGSMANDTALGETLLNDPEITSCPGIAQMMTSFRQLLGKSKHAPPVAMYGILAGDQVPVFWKCASGKVTEAETDPKQ
jgi:hypothetical protein